MSDNVKGIIFMVAVLALLFAYGGLLAALMSGLEQQHARIVLLRGVR